LQNLEPAFDIFNTYFKYSNTRLSGVNFGSSSVNSTLEMGKKVVKMENDLATITWTLVFFLRGHLCFSLYLDTTFRKI